MRHQANLVGWETLNKIRRPKVVPLKRKPDGRCKYCGRDIYWFKIKTKKGNRWAAFEEGEEGEVCRKGSKVLYNHRNMSQARKANEGEKG